MRVTEINIANSFLESVFSTRDKMDKLNRDIATGVKIHTMSDDPTNANSVLQLKNKISNNEQFQNNISVANAFMSTTALSLNNAVDLLINAKELMARATSTANPQELQTYAEETKQMFNELLQITNTNYNGKYIFGGVNTDQKPFTYDSITQIVSQNPNGIGGSINVDVAPQTQEPTNISGMAAFNGTAALDAILNLYKKYSAGTQPTAAEQQQVSDAMDKILVASVKAGTTLNRLDNFSSQMDSQTVSLQSVLSKVQDTEVAKAVVDLQHQQVILDTALKVGARVIPKSLVDFI